MKKLRFLEFVIAVEPPQLVCNIISNFQNPPLHAMHICRDSGAAYS